MTFPRQPPEADDAGSSNISARGRDRRLRHGLIWLLTGMALTVAFILWRAPVAAFGCLYVVFFMAALGYFQAREKT